MLEIVLTREDANTEYALVAEWLVEDRSEVTAGQPVCVVETTKATVEVESPGAGTIVQLYGEDVEVELGKTIAYVAESAEARVHRPRVEEKPAPRPLQGIDVRRARRSTSRSCTASISPRSTSDSSPRRTSRRSSRRARQPRPGGRPILAGVSTDGVSLPASFELGEAAGILDSAFLGSLDQDAFRARPAAEKAAALRTRAQIGEGVELGEDRSSSRRAS